MTETRDELLEATGAVLAREGYAGLTTKKVADEAGVSHPTVHYHFETKEGLLVAFVEEYTEEWLARLDAVEGADAAERLTGLLSLLVDGVLDASRAAYTRGMIELHTRAPHVDALQEALTRLDRRTTEYVADLIETGIEEGVFHDVDPVPMAELVLCAVDGASLRQHTLADDASRVLSEGLPRHVLADLYVGDVPSLGDAP